MSLHIKLNRMNDPILYLVWQCYLFFYKQRASARCTSIVSYKSFITRVGDLATAAELHAGGEICDSLTAAKDVVEASLAMADATSLYSPKKRTRNNQSMKPDTSAPCPVQKCSVNSTTKHRPYDVQTLGRSILSS